MRSMTRHIMYAAALALLLMACAKEANDAGGQQIANPASEYCIEQGGELEIVETPEGQQGICVIGDVRCDEWQYFRGECPVQ